LFIKCQNPLEMTKFFKINFIFKEHIILYVNPGEVFYCSCDYSPPIPIWLGSVNEDLSYNEQKVDGHSLIPPPPLPTRGRVIWLFFSFRQFKYK